LRYAHRRLSDGDLYFIANPAGAPVEARCGFRVTGRRPSLWDPATGEIFAVGPFEENDGRTWLRLPLEEHDSVFVVFHAGPLPPSARGTPRRPALCREMELAGPWEVRFPAGHGAPGQVRLDALADLAEHSDAGVRHFSGTAIYRKVFHLPVALPDVGRQLFLDLGKVQVMARARLNGQDLGVAWKPPFRLSLAQAARSGENVLEVEVANLWPNRLIGDQSLPPEKRIARTTWNPYRAGDKLFPSGLLGPVVVQSAAEDRRANGPNGSGP
jgi:hypothetical protein